MDDELKVVLVEARARVMWGNPVSEIREWLRSKGLAAAQIDRVVDLCEQERAIAVRDIGLRDVVIGGVLSLVGVAGILLHLALDLSSDRFFSLACVAVAFGFWRVLKGVEKLLVGPKVRGSLTEM